MFLQVDSRLGLLIAVAARFNSTETIVPSLLPRTYGVTILVAGRCLVFGMIAGFNSEDGFTYCDGYNLKNESKHLCWDLKHDLSNGKICQSLAFDCYFNSDYLTATVKNIVFSEKPILD